MKKVFFISVFFVLAFNQFVCAEEGQRYNITIDLYNQVDSFYKMNKFAYCSITHYPETNNVDLEAYKTDNNNEGFKCSCKNKDFALGFTLYKCNCDPKINSLKEFIWYFLGHKRYTCIHFINKYYDMKNK